MTHHDAKSAKLLDRYLLGELEDPERAAFEEHYFSCPLCAEEVVSGAKFIDNAREPLLGQERVIAPAAPWWDRWLAWAPKPALAGLSAVLGVALVWQNLPASLEPEVTGSYFVTATRAAGGPRKIAVAAGQGRVALLFNHTDTTIPRFDFLLENAEGQRVRQFEGDAPKDTNDIQVLVPVAGLRAGVYTLRVRNAGTLNEVAALPFELTSP